MSDSLMKKVQIGAVAGVAAYAGFKWVDSVHHVSNDIVMARRLLALKKKINEKYANGYNTTQMFHDTLAKFPNKTAILYLPPDDAAPQKITFSDMERISNQVSNWLLSRGVTRGDTVALFMENRIEFVTTWLGITKIGAKVAMINTSIVKKGLVHCIKISECKVVVFGAELSDSMRDVKEDIAALGIQVYAEGGEVDFVPTADAEIKAASTTAPPKKLRDGIGMSDTFGYIYTSGTTGLPKAAVILHAKMFAFGQLMSNAFVVESNDVVYTVLPLFHSAGGGLGCGMMMSVGCTMVLRQKFSAKRFFEDCGKYNVTVAQYIGELCRYLLQTPKSPNDRKHHVRICIGNGLRPEIWNDFQTRFNVPEIGEFYGATEGNGALVNHCTTKEAQGACGRMGTLLRKVTGMKIVKFDVDEEVPIRGPDGFCIECAHNEAGELLMPIKPDDPSSTFAGYSDKKATEKKILRDGFVKGDKYFRTGDLLLLDPQGFYRFVDRIGDTFRWKGENCATTEVTEVVSTFPGVEETNVVGVLIPNNQDGRAPLAAITPKDGDISNVDLKGLAVHLKKNLPPYAVPLFLRIMPEMPATATFKSQKVQVRNEGIDISKVNDPIYWLSPESGEYEPFGKDEFARVTTPGARL